MDPILMIIVLSLAAKYAGSDILYALRGKANPRHETVAQTRSARATARATRATARAAKSKARLARVQQRTERRANSALKRYWDVLKEDAVEDAIDAHKRHRAHKHERIEKREAARAGLRDGAPEETPGDTEAARGAARIYFMNRVNEARRAAAKRWEAGWQRMEENAQANKFKTPAPGDVVPGTVVSSEDDTTDPEPAPRPQDQPRSDQTSAATSTEPETPTADVQHEFGWVRTQYNGVYIPLAAQRPCPRGECDGLLTPEGEIHADEGDGAGMVNTVCNKGCGISSGHSWTFDDWEYQSIFGHAFDAEIADHDDDAYAVPYVADAMRVEQRLHTDSSAAGPSGADFHHPTTEGNPEMTNAPTEVTGLTSAISNSNLSAENARNAADGLELTIAGLEAGGTTGPAISHLNMAREALNAAAGHFDNAAQELGGGLGVRDAYAATGGNAGSKEFVTAD
jgi:hypothetical protein